MTDYVHLNPEFDDLPVLRVAASKMDDSDIEFQSHMSYLQDLLTDIELRASCHGVRVQPFPIMLTGDLDHAFAEFFNLKSSIEDFSRG